MSIGLASISEQPISSQRESFPGNTLPTTIDYFPEDAYVKTVDQQWPDEAILPVFLPGVLT